MKRDDYSSVALGRQIRPHDFRTYKFLATKGALRIFLQSTALDIQLNLFRQLNLQRRLVRGKPVWAVDDLGHQLVLRRAGAQIGAALAERTRHRNQICECLSSMLSDREPYRVVRLDISSFFESIPRGELRTRIDRRLRDLPVTRRICSSLLDAVDALPAGRRPDGVPRGTSVSQYLSDLYLEEFDQLLQKDPRVFFYARYVDDIIMVTDPAGNPAELLDDIQRYLPPGLELNPRKTQIREAKPLKKLKGTQRISTFDSFEYLGYEFTVEDVPGTPPSRVTTLDLSSRKRKKLMTRLAISFRECVGTGDLRLLKDRLKVITGSYSFYSSRSHRRILTGVKFSYPLADPEPGGGMSQLDAFLRSCLFDRDSRAVSQFARHFSIVDRRNLACFNFSKDFRKPRIRHFTQSRLRTIVKAWKYVV